MGGWSYVIRVLKGESPADVIASMPKKDYEKVASVIDGLKDTNMSRQQRRSLERKFKTVRR